MKKLFKNYRRFTAITFTVLFTLGLVMIGFLQNYTPTALGDSDSIFNVLFESFMSKPTNILLLVIYLTLICPSQQTFFY